MKFDNILLSIFINGRGIIKEKISRLDNYPNIKQYIELRFSDSFSIEETLKRIQHNIEEKPVCPCCGKHVKYVGGTRLYLKTCGNKECSKKINALNGKQTCINKYGVDNIAKLNAAKQKQAATNIERYGAVSPLQNEHIKKKTNNTNIKKYGCEVAQQSDIVKEKIRNSNKETCLQRYSVSNISKLQETSEKRRNTCFEKYGAENIMSTEYIKNNINIINKKRNDTKRKNNTFNTSTIENECYLLLSILFGNVIRQYKDERYPFNCDFYVPDYDLFIEYNGSWTHGGHLYDENNINDIELANKWKTSTSKYYNNAYETWVIRDRKKYEYLKQLNHIIFWNFDEVLDFITHIPLNDTLLNKEYKNILKAKGSLSKHCHQNNIIKYFQQDVFYKIEKELWYDDNIRQKLIINRQQYLNKFNLTPYDILQGFKRSGIYYGYSHFNPLWIKWFIQEYNIKTCYDPCGGWGHRLLGANDLELYIYNDLSTSTYNNVNRIIDYFKIRNTITYNNDASTFIPKESFESMFTCPPYYNVEEYECGGFNSIEDYNSFIDSLFNVFYITNSCKIFGIVIREDLLDEKYKKICKYRFDLNINIAHHLNSKKQKNEYLYIFKKDAK